MPGLLMHVNATMRCLHGAAALIAPSQTRVLVGGMPVATMSSAMSVAGCPFQVPVGAGTKPQPCVTVNWAMPSTRFQVGGSPAALLPAPGPGPALCRSIEQIPQGAPTIGSVQTRVTGA